MSARCRSYVVDGTAVRVRGSRPPTAGELEALALVVAAAIVEMRGAQSSEAGPDVVTEASGSESEPSPPGSADGAEVEPVGAELVVATPASDQPSTNVDQCVCGHPRRLHVDGWSDCDGGREYCPCAVFRWDRELAR